jgi:3-oxoacyl-[acyl-carrier protein] reductase
MTDLSDKIALVTGGSRGIGRAICVALGQQKARVVINYAGNEAAAHETAKLVSEAGGPDPVVMQFDVSDSEAVDEAFKKVKADLGGLHILVNNAGIARDMLLLRYKNSDWDATIGTNLSGAFYCSRAAAKLMTKQRWGRIIQITSVVGEAGNGGQVAYSAAKAGLIGMTKSMAKELASRSITVNAVAPGLIETDMTADLSDDMKAKALEHIPLGTAGAPEDVAAAVTYLASEQARYVTGHTLSVNGGMYM